MFFVEMLGTFILVSVILCIKYHFGSKELTLNAFTIGLTLFTVLTVAAGLSGGCINPAIGFAQPLFQVMMSRKYPSLEAAGLAVPISADTTWLYFLAPLTGGIIAGAF